MECHCRHSSAGRQRYFGSVIVPDRNATIGGMARHFDPQTLRLFVAVCEERNIARAAQREAIVPSAVSKRIAAIERDIGAPLLVRGRRGIEPTAAGQTLLRQARDMLGAMEVAPGGTRETLLRRQAAVLGRTLAYRIQVASLNAACRIVAAGLGLAVLPREAVGPDVHAAGLVQLPLHEPWVERRFVVCSR